MSLLLNSLQTGDAKTANGAVTNSSSLNACLDFFFIAWASRTMSENDILSLFTKAYANDKKTALAILFWARDVRNWAGERRLFRIVLTYLFKEQRMSRLDSEAFFSYVVEYGRWDDLFFSEEITEITKAFIVKNVMDKEANNGLLFKWLPREKSKNKAIARIIRDALWMSPKAYRKALADNSDTTEQLLSKNKWEDVDYSRVPSKAFSLYRTAFYNHDNERFDKFIQAAENGEAKINAWAIFPHDLYTSWEKANGSEYGAINAQWNSLPDYGNDENILPICDVSGSMSGLPIQVSVSLWVYLSERNSGLFKDAFLTFSSSPQLQHLKGSATDRFRQLRRADWGRDTNLQASFKLILSAALRDNIPSSDMPAKVLIISDMEFNEASSWTNLSAIKAQYEEAGYEMPWIIFWNVNGRRGNVPANINDDNVALISGFSPSIVKSVLGGDDLSPTVVMLKALSNYSFVNNLIK